MDSFKLFNDPSKSSKGPIITTITPSILNQIGQVNSLLASREDLKSSQKVDLPKLYNPALENINNCLTPSDHVTQNMKEVKEMVNVREQEELLVKRLLLVKTSWTMQSNENWINSLQRTD